MATYERRSVSTILAELQDVREKIAEVSKLPTRGRSRLTSLDHSKTPAELRKLERDLLLELKAARNGHVIIRPQRCC